MAQQRGVNSLQFNQDQSKLIANAELTINLQSVRDIYFNSSRFALFFYRLFLLRYGDGSQDL